jgi:nucleoside-diphosphate-sugar epimerase
VARGGDIVRVFVTGGTGFIGGHLVHKLLARGDSVTALARDPQSTAAQSLEAAGAIIKHGDVTERESMREGMERAEVVYHVAGWYKVGARDKKPAYTINVEGTRNTIGLAVELGVPRVVYVSTVGVFGNTRGRTVEPVVPERDDWISEHDRTKYLAHEVADEFIKKGAPVVICCPSLVYGPDDPQPIGKFIRLLLRRRLPVLPGKLSGGSWVHVEDVADGLIAAAGKGRPGEIYVLGGDRLTQEEAVGFIGEVSGIRMPLLLDAGPVPLLKTVMTGVSAVVPVPEHYHPEMFAQLDNVTWWVSHEKSTQELGYNPRPYQEGLRETVLYEMDQLDLR